MSGTPLVGLDLMPGNSHRTAKLKMNRIMMRRRLADPAAAVRLAESWAGGTNTMTNWVSAEGVSTTPSGTIPDNTPNGFFQATATVTQGITIERLEVDIVLTAAKSNQLKALLTSPSGTKHTLFDRPLTVDGPTSAWPYVFTMGLTAFMGLTSNLLGVQ